jgi:hypothetical protein
VEEELRGRIDQFEERMRGLNRDLEIFMKKDPPGDDDRNVYDTCRHHREMIVR